MPRWVRRMLNWTVSETDLNHFTVKQCLFIYIPDKMFHGRANSSARSKSSVICARLHPFLQSANEGEGVATSERTHKMMWLQTHSHANEAQTSVWRRNTKEWRKCGGMEMICPSQSHFFSIAYSIQIDETSSTRWAWRNTCRQKNGAVGSWDVNWYQPANLHLKVSI